MKLVRREIEFGLADWFFVGGLALKLVLSVFFASSVLQDLFIPFVSYFVQTGFSNPYEAFAESNGVAYFPYPALMLYILALPELLLGWVSDHENFTLFIIRLPLLVADLTIFFVLKSWLKQRYFGKLVAFYWFSPVLLYISYIHGQLDAIPIALLFGGLFFLFKDRIVLSAILLGMALAAKTNVLIVLPFFLIFLARKNANISQIVAFTVIVPLIFVLLNVGYLTNVAFIQMVFNNQEQLKLFDVSLNINKLSVYLIPFALMLLFLRGAVIRTYNRDLFVMFLGFSFCVLLLFIPPMPGWYYWMLPFLCYFYIKQEGGSAILLLALQMFYFLYFIVGDGNNIDAVSLLLERGLSGLVYPENAQPPALDKQLILNLTFTFLQVTLLINCAWIYQRGLQSYSSHKITASPYLIGIGGNSGVGKSKLSDALSSVFGSHNTTVVRGDDMHKWQRGHEKWQEMTHLDPKANHLHREVYFLKRLKSGRKIHRRQYDHDIGDFTAEKAMQAKNIVIFEGLHPFFLASQRVLYDLKVFIKPSDSLARHWKIIRDREHRGYSKEKIIEAIEVRRQDSAKYVETQDAKADFLIRVFPVDDIINLGDSQEKIELSYQLSFSNEAYIEPLVAVLENEPSLQIEHEYKSDDLQVLTLRGSCSSDLLEGIAADFISGLEDIGVSNARFPGGLFGVLVVVLIYTIFEKEMYDRR